MYRIIYAIFIDSWWVFLFMIFCFFCYEQAARHLGNDFNKLHQQLETLQTAMQNSLALQEDLRLQINSQSDPAWIELTLMKGLGLVPEGQIKVYFKPGE